MARNRYEILCAKVRAEFPRFRVVRRDDSWLRLVFAVLSFVLRRTFGTYTTTIGSTMYVPANWDDRGPDSQYATLRHELMHIRQFHSFPFGRRLWVLNHVVMGLCYLLVLPALWTMRARFEREGYTQTLLVRFELHGAFSDAQRDALVAWMGEVFGGSSYAWMWRRKAAERWARETIDQIHSGAIVNYRDRVDLPPALQVV